MAKFFKTSFKKMRFNPLCDGPMLHTYEDLTEIIDPKWTDDPLLDKIIRYVLMVYDPNSAVFLSESDLNVRRGVAANLSGLDKEGQELLMTIYTHEYCFVYRESEDSQPKLLRYIPHLVSKYLRRFPKSREHAAIVATEFKFWENIMQMMEPIVGKNSKEALEASQKKGLMSDELEKDQTRINSYYNNFYGGDEELADIVQEKKQQRFDPQSIADTLKNKQ